MMNWSHSENSLPSCELEICHLEFNDEPYLLNYNKQLAEKWEEILEEKANLEQSIPLFHLCETTGLFRKEYGRLGRRHPLVETIHHPP